MDKLMLITGGTSGIGLGIAKSCVNEYRLALSYASNHDRANEALSALKKINPDASIELFCRTLSSVGDCHTLMDDIKEKFGELPDILINSAGRLRDGIFMGTSMVDHEDMVKEHLIVPMALSQMCLKKMYKNKFGRIINLSSITARRAKKGQVNYSTVKSGVEGLTRSLALEVAHRGVTVNAVAPGIIETPMTSQLIDGLQEANKSARDVVPVGFFGEAKDIGSVVYFLCSESARYITGQILTVDGGRSLGEVK